MLDPFFQQATKCLASMASVARACCAHSQTRAVAVAGATLVSAHPQGTGRHTRTGVAASGAVQRAVQIGGLVMPNENRLPPFTVQAKVLPSFVFTVT